MHWAQSKEATPMLDAPASSNGQVRQTNGWTRQENPTLQAFRSYQI